MPDSDLSRPLGGRFIPRKHLKESHGVSSFFGEDSKTQRHVLLKIVNCEQVAAAALLRIRHEAQILSALEVRGVAKCLGYGDDPPYFWLATTWTNGPTLAEHLYANRLSCYEGALLALRLAEALCEVHARGILHRDVKPSNVVLANGDTKLALLIDFGFAWCQNVEASGPNEPLGTALYISPEQAGLTDLGVDERSDLYSLGALLYESVSGAPPFCGSTVNEVLGKHLSHPPRPLSISESATARVFCDIVLRLLAKDPRDRYQTAEGLIHDLRAVIQSFERKDRAFSLVLGASEIRQAVTEPMLIGRERELEQLTDQIKRSQIGLGGLIFVEGESGVGKTRLTNEALRRAAEDGFWILKGYELDQTAKRPRQVLSSVARSVAKRAHEDSKSDYPRQAGGLVSGTASKAVG